MTYNIVKQGNGDVNLIEITSGYTRVLKPTFLPYHALGRVYFGNGDNVAFSEITQLNGSGTGLPADINAMIVKLNNDFFTGDSGGGGGATDLDQLPDGDARVAVTPDERTFLQVLIDNANTPD